MPDFTNHAMDLAAQFMSGGGSAARPGGGFPQGLNVGNMGAFGQSPAGRQLLGSIMDRTQARRRRPQQQPGQSQQKRMTIQMYK